jgi:hypothetical protein
MLPNFPKLHECASIDKLRPNLQHVFVDYKNGYFVATSGFILAAVPFHFFKSDNFDFGSGTADYIPAKAWKELSKPTTTRASFDGNTIKIWDKSGTSSIYECLTAKEVGNFPFWTRVIPSIKDVSEDLEAYTRYTSINPRYLVKLSDALGYDAKHYVLPILGTGSGKAYITATEDGLIGLLMPVHRPENTTRAIHNALKGLDKVRTSEVAA